MKIPTRVETLNNMKIIDMAGGFYHTLALVAYDNMYEGSNLSLN